MGVEQSRPQQEDSAPATQNNARNNRSGQRSAVGDGRPRHHHRPHVMAVTRNQRPQVPPPPQVQNTKTVRSNFNLKKDSLQLKWLRGDGDRCVLTFRLDTTVECRINIFYCAVETDDEKRFVPLHEYEQCSIPAGRGLGQIIEVPEKYALDISKYDPEEELVYKKGDRFPFVIVVEPVGEDDDTNSLTVSSQTTFASLEEDADNPFGVHIIKQKIEVDGKKFTLQDIFGFDNSTQKDGDEEGSNTECVICMSEKIDTTVLNCRHMCLCHECADELRFKSNKCPICRQPISSLLRLKIKNDSQAEPGPSGTEEEVEEDVVP